MPSRQLLRYTITLTDDLQVAFVSLARAGCWLELPYQPAPPTKNSASSFLRRQESILILLFFQWLDEEQNGFLPSHTAVRNNFAGIPETSAAIGPHGVDATGNSNSQRRPNITPSSFLRKHESILISAKRLKIQQN